MRWVLLPGILYLASGCPKPQPVPRVEIAPVVVAPVDPEECANPVHVEVGDVVQCAGVITSSKERIELLDTERRMYSLEAALGECYGGWDADRAALRDAAKQVQLMRASGALGFVGGTLFGGLVTAADGWVPLLLD